jgi:hypothetical protein
MAHVRFYVSAINKVRVSGSERPYGLQHARQPGNAFTECGEQALTWPLFWDLPFQARLEGVCRACVNSVLTQEPRTLDSPEGARDGAS